VYLVSYEAKTLIFIQHFFGKFDPFVFHNPATDRTEHLAISCHRHTKSLPPWTTTYGIQNVKQNASISVTMMVFDKMPNAW
jgi:hypothetical protein